MGDLTTTTLYSVLHNNETPTLKGGESERRQLIQELGLFRCRKGRHFADHTHAHTRNIFFYFLWCLAKQVRSSLTHGDIVCLVTARTATLYSSGAEAAHYTYV